MKKIIFLVLLLTLINADLPPPNSTHKFRSVSISNAEDFKGISIIHCSFDMSDNYGCSRLKNNFPFSSYKFKRGSYLFAIKDKTLKKYGGVKALNKPPLKKAFKYLLKNLRSPIGESRGYYISNDNFPDEHKNTKVSYKITEIKNGYLILKKIESTSKKPVEKESNSRLYKLFLEKNSGVYTQKIRSLSNYKKSLFVFTHKEWGKILFENGKDYINIEIPKKISKKRVVDTIFVISKKGESEKLLGAFSQFNFTQYSFLKESERERYNQSKKAKEESTHSHNWSKAWDVCGGYIALKKDGSLWQFGELNQCSWGDIGFMDSKFIKRNIYTYPLKPTKISTGFTNAKFINGGFSFYIIKRDGTLWKKDYDTPFKQIGKDTDWVTVGIDTGVHDRLDYDIGLKKDGSLWDISKETITSLSRYKNWDKIWIDGASIYAQKKDRTVWMKHSRDEEFKIDNEIKIANKMKKIPSGEIDIKKDGTLWLPPKIDTEEVEKTRSITIYPNPENNHKIKIPYPSIP